MATDENVPRLAKRPRLSLRGQGISDEKGSLYPKGINPETGRPYFFRQNAYGEGFDYNLAVASYNKKSDSMETARSSEDDGDNGDKQTVPDWNQARSFEDENVPVDDHSQKAQPAVLLEPESVDETEEEFIQKIEEAFKCGEEIARRLAHAMLIGPPGSGKSSLLDRLLQRMRRKCSTSTNVAESIVTVEVRLQEKPSMLHAAMVIDGEWVEFEFNESLITHMPLQETVIGRSQEVPEKHSQHMIYQLLVTSTPARLPQLHLPPSMISYLQEKFGSYKQFKLFLEKGFSLYLRDTGGQIEFQEILPLLIFGPSIFFFIFRLDLPFNEKFQVKYRDEDKDFNSYMSSLTIEEALLQCLATVDIIKREEKASFETRDPYVFIVGTHKDKLLQQLKDCNSSISLEEELHQRNRNLDVLLKKRGFDRLVSYAGNDAEHVMYTVDNTSKDEKDFDLIRSRINAVVSSRKEFLIRYPINYLLFCLDLQNVKDNIIFLQDFKERALRFGIEGDVEVSLLLHFLCNRIGIIQHFDKGGIRHIVVNQPQFLYSKVSKLVIETFKGKTLRAEERVDLEKGILSFEAAESIIGATGMIKTSELLVLLTNLRIIAPLKNGKYFIPCVINHLSETCDQELTPEEVAPLYICFQRKHCPKGLFAVLVTYLLEEAKSTVINLQFSLDKVHKDQVSFEVESGEDILDILHVKVIACSFLEIAFFPEERDPSLISDICVTIRNLIEEYLSKSFRDLHYNEELVKYEMCLRCECCSELHKVLSASKLRCKRKKLPLPEKGKYWFSDSNAQPESQKSSRVVSEATELPAPQQNVKQPKDEILDFQTATAKSSSASIALVERFGVTEKSVNRRVSDVHMMEISRCSCQYWKRLYPYLDLEKIDVADVDKLNGEEREKRQAFLALWREKKGSAATYGRLISALLQTDCREDAEKVCLLLKSQLNS